MEIVTPQQAVAQIPNGASIMFGGFMGCGTPPALVRALREKDIKDITLICNDCGLPGYGVAPLIDERRVKKVIASHIGLTPVVGTQMNEGTLDVQLVPQGTLAEQVRSAGAGLGGFLTPTGVGTPVEKDKQKITINGKTYLLELPLSADVALLKAHKADEAGNLVYRFSTRNFNPLMAMAAKLVIAEVDEIVPVGSLDPDQIHTPAIFVDKLVRA